MSDAGERAALMAALQEATARIEAIAQSRAYERFERTSPSKLCTATVNLRQQLVDFQFLQANAMRELDRVALAEEVRSTIAAAQAKAREATDLIAAEVYAELGLS
ncbi:YbaB/EbfC family nucleoid-associated protein [Glycomyces sp. NPDC021274]|jgi:DNA-binding protein YbaB|uniref:YbaB/EbfC family nucleoid-associated protein n=1 Tax=Glycomyces sp. NPDC021274 TaxID=3155120 RepID=UPI0033DED3D8